MSEKALKALVGTLTGLVLIWLLVTFLPQGEGGAGSASPTLSSFFDGVTPEGVSGVLFQGPEDAARVELRRMEGRWMVNGFRADSGAVERFWEALQGATLGDLVASNPDNHPRMGVAADSAWTLEIEMGEETRALLVGKGGNLSLIHI